MIFCAGGVASLFYDNIAWQHPFSGISLSVLKDAGACLTNEGFIQMLWLNSETLEFVVFNTFKEKNTFIIQGDKKNFDSLYRLNRNEKHPLSNCLP